MTQQHHKLRIAWGSQIGFLLAAIGATLGLGNAWRFAYLTYENGGAAFFIPYLVALLTAGLPLLILELALGHKKHGASSLAFAKINRRTEWLGWWLPALATFGVLALYAVVIGWYANYTIFSVNLSWGADPQTFFLKDFLHLSAGVFQWGELSLPLLLSVALVWLMIWLITSREVPHGIERACLVFLPLLFILTIILIGWGLTLPGAWQGLKWYLRPDYAKLLNWQVWLAAYSQIFFTLALSFGVMIAYASYLPKRTDLVKTAVLTSLVNCLFSLLAGLAVFIILGYLAAKNNLALHQVTQAGPALIFVVIPQAISQLPAFRSLFGFLFFGALLLAGLASGIAILEAFSRAVTDKFELPRPLVVGLLCWAGFLCSLVFTSGAGLYWLDIVDHYVNQYGLVLAGLWECLVAGWLLKAHVLRTHINAVSDWGVTRLWDWAIRYFTPAILLVILISNFLMEINLPYGPYDLVTPLVIGGGWLLATLLIGIILGLPKWDQKKIDYNHFAQEDQLLV